MLVKTEGWINEPILFTKSYITLEFVATVSINLFLTHSVSSRVVLIILVAQAIMYHVKVLVCEA